VSKVDGGYRSTVLSKLHGSSGGSKPADSADAQSLARRVASARKLGTTVIAAGATAALGAAVTPASAEATTGDFCVAAGTGIALFNPYYSATPFTCIRYQQWYYPVQHVSGSYRSGGACAGDTSSGNVDPRHISNMPDVYGRYTCGNTGTIYCGTQCSGYSAHPFIKDATSKNGPRGGTPFQGYIAY
jgi:hypothetical protein